MRPAQAPRWLTLLLALAACGGDSRRPLGATCEASSECESGLCYEGICVDPATVGDTATGDVSAADAATDTTTVAPPDVAPVDTQETLAPPDAVAADVPTEDTAVDPGPETFEVFFADTYDFTAGLHATRSAGVTYVVGSLADRGTLYLAFEGTGVGTYTCAVGSATDVAWQRTPESSFQHSNIDNGSCTIKVTEYGAVGERIVGTFDGMLGDPMPGMEIPYNLGVFSVVRAPDDDCATAPACGFGCPADPAPPAECPAACTGGCAAGVCTIDCSGSKCTSGGPPPGPTVACPSGMACRIDCSAGGCIGAQLVCPDVGACDIACAGAWACQDASVTCGAGACFASSCGTADPPTSTATFLGWTCGASCACDKGCGL